ncbi:hypothetical protein Tco_0873697 [Tanacetum coccineum]|uniref:Uncharacterized protein n=1 Tax=Tanacetum coccineum TaxID=301880 RepID=A0ABQ5BJI6_9ASTR
MKEDTSMCDLIEENYVYGYHRGYHDQNSRHSYSYQNCNPNRHHPYPPNRMPYPYQYFELPKTSLEEMMREWMARKMEANERMKDQVVEFERKINQGLRNCQAIIENLERQFEFLDKKIFHNKSLPRNTHTKPRHEFVYKPLSNQNENDKGDVKAIEEDVTQPIPTMPNLNLISFNSPTLSPYLKDCTVHIPYSNTKMFADDVLTNHVGGEEFKSIGGVGTGEMTKKKIEKDDDDVPKEPNKEWKLSEKVDPHNKDIYHYFWHPTEIPHLNRIIKES